MKQTMTITVPNGKEEITYPHTRLVVDEYAESGALCLLLINDDENTIIASLTSETEASKDCIGMRSFVDTESKWKKKVIEDYGLGKPTGKNDPKNSIVNGTKEEYAFDNAALQKFRIPFPWEKKKAV